MTDSDSDSVITGEMVAVGELWPVGLTTVSIHEYCRFMFGQLCEVQILLRKPDYWLYRVQPIDGSDSRILKIYAEHISIHQLRNEVRALRSVGRDKADITDKAPVIDFTEPEFDDSHEIRAVTDHNAFGLVLVTTEIRGKPLRTQWDLLDPMGKNRLLETLAPIAERMLLMTIPTIPHVALTYSDRESGPHYFMETTTIGNIYINLKVGFNRLMAMMRQFPVQSAPMYEENFPRDNFGDAARRLELLQRVENALEKSDAFAYDVLPFGQYGEEWTFIGPHHLTMDNVFVDECGRVSGITGWGRCVMAHHALTTAIPPLLHDRRNGVADQYAAIREMGEYRIFWDREMTRRMPTWVEMREMYSGWLDLVMLVHKLPKQSVWFEQDLDEVDDWLARYEETGKFMGHLRATLDDWHGANLWKHVP